MIAQLIGKLLHKEPTYIILDVGGVGYGLHISLYTFDQIKGLDHCTLLTVMQVKSDALTLYGFYTLEEKSWWLYLTSVSSIGPKIALTILSSLTPAALHKAILSKDTRLLTSIKGVGAKAAQRLILELSDKAQKLDYIQDPVLPQPTQNKVDQDAIMALTKLGLTQKVAENAIETVRAQVLSPLTLEELIKKALQPHTSSKY
ncbi:MAG: Holliday junction branch migration protein RuvA [Candidatus Cardinium sp.]|uniref:Holliday junction branch migration protein RuvA n=1 Tax=Cardinium endosymbiont of Dermatophagoides farinae TaxID=2597823 RepID=UPI001182DA4E|nr:Holliday junction branch migration protein RuvA [Cardinium endosymbiont of Dermatophagoides farinae]TSJ80738.1 Holliday junction branch migration protein RuvA [Cardinium endosymbiont of Dermatophagoides farinae]UWW96737.1 MAG: Holliday junction branch migration protein RuvA [Candidatus Cardinium sp.]